MINRHVQPILWVWHRRPQSKITQSPMRFLITILVNRHLVRLWLRRLSFRFWNSRPRLRPITDRTSPPRLSIIASLIIRYALPKFGSRCIYSLVSFGCRWLVGWLLWLCACHVYLPACRLPHKMKIWKDPLSISHTTFPNSQNFSGVFSYISTLSFFTRESLSLCRL